MAQPVSNIAFSKLFHSPLANISRWQCVVGDDGSTASTSPRMHVVSFTHTGAFQLETAGEWTVIDANRAMILRAGESYRMSRAFGRKASGIAVALRPDVVRSMLPRFDEEAPAVVARESCARAYLLQHLVVSRILGGEAQPLEIEEAAMAIAGHALHMAVHIASESVMPSPRRKARLLAEETKALLAANCQKAIHLDDVARALDLSPFHLCREFARQTGMPMHRYLTRLRLRSTLELIADPKASLTDVALAHGFSSHSHFASAFRTEFGMTPNEVRRLATRACVRALADAMRN